MQGQHYDEESGLHYNRHRYYDSHTGRYVTQDPIGLEGGFNYYQYAKNSPSNFIDPTGEIVPLLVAGAIILGKAALGATIDIGVQTGGQVKDNWDNGNDLFDIDTDCIDIDWGSVGVSALVSTVAPGMLSTAKTVKNSAGAIKTIKGQAANTVNKQHKQAARIKNHEIKIRDALAIQAGWQGTKYIGKCVFGEEKEKCQDE